MRARAVGAVAQLARYPVKSMAGERLGEATVEHRGLVGDRGWAVYTADGASAAARRPVDSAASTACSSGVPNWTAACP